MSDDDKNIHHPTGLTTTNQDLSNLGSMYVLPADLTLLYSRIHVDCQMAVIQWACFGEMPGNFIQALLRNDLAGACARADGTNISLIPVWALLMVNILPGTCWGSKEKMDIHAKRRALLEMPLDDVDWPDCWAPQVERVRVMEKRGDFDRRAKSG